MNILSVKMFDNAPSFFVEKKYRVFRHLLVFLCVLAFTFDNDSAYDNKSIDFWVKISSLFIIESVIYLNLYLFIPKLLYKGRFISYFVSWLVLVFLIYLLFIFVKENYLAQHLLSKQDDISKKNFWLNYWGICILFSVFIGSTTSMKLLQAWVRDNQRINDLEKGLVELEMVQLKDQINPHFLFNSLNVLSGLLKQDPVKAEKFISELAQIYRYVLEFLEKQVALLSDELRFAQLYMHLQQVRYGEQELQFYVNVPSDALGRFLPPLSLQTVLENAMKHNSTDIHSPLKIEIVCENNFLVIKNNLQARQSNLGSLGIGQKNIIQRYLLFTDIKPEFYVENNEYIVKLPLIEAEL